jgi:hypothetical protein
MLHIFDQKDFEPQLEKKPPLSRLQQVLTKESTAVGQDTAELPALVEDGWTAAPAPTGPSPRNGRPLPIPPEVRPADQFPIAAAGRPMQNRNAELPGAEQFTEQFARTFLESMTGAVKQLYELVNNGRSEKEMEPLRAGLAALGGQFQQIEKRLELQAGVIRTLHAMLQSREERLERMLAAFKGLHAVGGQTDQTSLPDGL